MKIEIRKADINDLDGIFRIEKETFTDYWSYESLYEDIYKTPISYYLVASSEKEVIGYIGMWHVLDEAHILNIAVDKIYRHLGVGTNLLSSLIEYSEHVGIKRMTLEVREHNDNALKLYEKFGFMKNGRRKEYYRDTMEDAIIMWKEL
ncbi:MAG: ribosomal protein S18-alanine N-acetyltransferase [Clostridia bacterium]|jgi:ribosomal-protein-alanine N-acetyltransferase